MNKNDSMSFAACIAFAASPSSGFEIATHAAITNAAWSRAIAESPALLQRLGLNSSARGESRPIGTNYFDVLQSVVSSRALFQFEANIIQSPPTEGLGLT